MEKIILKNLIKNEEYVRRVLPFLKPEYFTDYNEKLLFETVHKFIDEYNVVPTKESLIIELDKNKTINEDSFDTVVGMIDEIQKDNEKENIDFLLKETESFCQDKSLYNALMESVKLADDDSNKNLSRGNIPDILKKALSISFDEHIGHDFIDDAGERYEFYHRKISRIPFDIHLMNEITDGGLMPKTLNVLMAGPGAGKTLAMSHFASANLMDGKNVLYITMEIAEERIAERIEANLMDMNITDVKILPKKLYQKRIEKIRDKTEGRLKIKEYPTSSANVNHFRFLLNELKLKKDFTPDVIYVDYLNICSSSRYKSGSNANSYTIVKAVAEELRGLATEYQVPIVTATQVNRQGISNSDMDMENLSDSMGTGHTADLILGLIVSDELDQLGQIQVKQIKNRYSDPTKNKRFLVGMDRGKMKWYDVEQNSQSSSNKQTSSSPPQNPYLAQSPSKKSSKNKFGNFKF